MNDSGEELIKRLYRTVTENPERAREVLAACKLNTPAVFERLRDRLETLHEIAEDVQTWLGDEAGS